MGEEEAGGEFGLQVQPGVLQPVGRHPLRLPLQQVQVPGYCVARPYKDDKKGDKDLMAVAKSSSSNMK